MTGPRPTPPPPALSAARERVLRAVADAAGPVTLADLAERLGGHPNTTRQQLDALAVDGLVDARVLQRETRGRPPQAFTLTDLGRRALGAHPEYAEMLGAFATYLVRRGRPGEEAREVGAIWGAERADAVASRLAAGASAPPGPADGLVEVLAMLGFEPERARTPADEPAVVLRACPLLGLAREHPEVICELHRGLVDGVMRRLGASGGVELIPFAEPDGCRVRLP